MLITQYAHRLTGDFEMGRIRTRAAERGPDFDTHPGLIFKAFMLREKGRHGSSANLYSSLYLWKDTAAFADFLSGERFATVSGTFGRPPVETWLPFAAEIGDVSAVRFVEKVIEEISPDADLGELRRVEAGRARAEVEKKGGASVVALDIANWRLGRFRLLAEAPVEPTGVLYEVAYLAKPDIAKA